MWTSISEVERPSHLSSNVGHLEERKGALLANSEQKPGLDPGKLGVWSLHPGSWLILSLLFRSFKNVTCTPETNTK